MKQANYPYSRMFEAFIRDSKNGKRRLKNGNRIRQSSIGNYYATLNKINQFQQALGLSLQLRHVPALGRREQMKEKKYWQRFGSEFSGFLQSQGLLDNYVGFHLKNLKVFHNYLKIHRNIDTGDMSNSLVVLKEETPVVVLSPERLKFLIFNSGFNKSLPGHLQVTLDMFVFGCTTSLRFSDLIAIRSSNLHLQGGSTYLVNSSKKTNTETRIKLPEYCLGIIKKYRRKQVTLLPSISLAQFNTNLKTIFELAGWTESTPKIRHKRGVPKTLKTADGKYYRFCDLASSHLMRKSAITSMLLLGMPEPLVRKISGHAPNSKEFYRYVKYSQSFLDEHTDKVFERLQAVEV